MTELEIHLGFETRICRKVIRRIVGIFHISRRLATADFVSMEEKLAKRGGKKHAERKNSQLGPICMTNLHDYLHDFAVTSVRIFAHFGNSPKLRREIRFSSEKFVFFSLSHSVYTAFERVPRFQGLRLCLLFSCLLGRNYEGLTGIRKRFFAEQAPLPEKAP